MSSGLFVDEVSGSRRASAFEGLPTPEEDCEKHRTLDLCPEGSLSNLLEHNRAEDQQEDVPPFLSPTSPPSQSPLRVPDCSFARNTSTREESNMQSERQRLSLTVPDSEELVTGNKQQASELEMQDEKRRRKERIQRKVEKAKEHVPPKAKLQRQDEAALKKQLQLVRNRLSAQRSRERKQQELALLAADNQKLRMENEELQQQLAGLVHERFLDQETLKLLPTSVQQDFDRIRAELCAHSLLTADRSEWQSRPSGPWYRNPLLLSTMFLGILCIVACMSVLFLEGTQASVASQMLQPRMLATSTEISPEFLSEDLQ